MRFDPPIDKFLNDIKSKVKDLAIDNIKKFLCNEFDKLDKMPLVGKWGYGELLDEYNEKVTKSGRDISDAIKRSTITESGDRFILEIRDKEISKSIRFHSLFKPKGFDPMASFRQI